MIDDKPKSDQVIANPGATSHVVKTDGLPKDALKVEPPWTLASLKDRYGEEGGEEVYCRIAEQGGYFNARADKSYRPDLHP